MKTCTGCGKDKPEDHFFARKDSPNEKLRQPCKRCTADRNAGWRSRTGVKYPDSRKNRPKDKARMARLELEKARRRGEIERPDRCQECGVECVPDGHHPDHNYPLDVIWLCRKCHANEHRKYK